MPKRSQARAASALLLAGLLALSGAGACQAADDQQQQQKQITLQQAVDMAVASSGDLRVARYSIDQAEDRRDAAALKLTYTPTGQASPETESAFNSLVSADLTLKQQKRSYQASLDGVAMTVYQAYFDILQDQAALEAARQDLSLADLQQRAATLNHQLGGASGLEKQQASDTATTARASLATAETSLADAYQQFNQLVGLLPDERPDLVDQPSFAPLEIDSLEAEVSRALASSPSVLNKADAVDQAKTALLIYSYSQADINTYQATKTNIDIAEQNLVLAKDSAAQSLRTLYYNIRQLESDRNDLQQKLNTAGLNLSITQAKYDTGAASQIDLRTAQSALAAAERSLLSNTCQHQLQTQTFRTPWAQL